MSLTCKSTQVENEGSHHLQKSSSLLDTLTTKHNWNACVKEMKPFNKLFLVGKKWYES